MSKYDIDFDHGEFPVAMECELENGVRAEIHYDQYGDGCNPREWDQLAHLAVSYDGYELGDEQLPREGLPPIECPHCRGLELQGPAQMVPTILGESEELPECPRCDGYGEVEPTVDEWLADREAVVAAPLFVYEHSGITIRDGAYKVAADITREDCASRGRFMGDDAGWDTSFVGFVYVTEERALALGIPGTHGDEVVDREKMIESMIEQAEGEVSEYAKYLEGDVYFIVTSAPDGQTEGAIGGFIGHEVAEEEAKSMLAYEAEAYDERVAKENAERSEWAARDVVTV